MSRDTVTLRRRHAFSVVPDAILTHPRLSHASVRALAWALGRPDGWELRIGYWCEQCHLTDKSWPSVKKQLMSEGFLRQWKTRGERGVFVWHQEITDDPLFSSTIPPFGRDGSGMHADGSNAGGGDKAVGGESTKGMQQQHRTEDAKRLKKGDQVIQHGVELWTLADHAGLHDLVVAHGAEAIAEVAAQIRPAQGHLAPFLSAVAAALHERDARKRAEQKRAPMVDLPPANPAVAKRGIAACKSITHPGCNSNADERLG